MEEILKNHLNYETEEAILTGKCSNEEIVIHLKKKIISLSLF